jgi:hypothetical protein
LITRVKLPEVTCGDDSASITVTEMVKVPAAVGMPLSTPLALRLSPGGSPVFARQL